MAQYAIHECNIEKLEAKLMKIRNKCKKLGCDYRYKRIGEEFREIEIDGVKQTAKFILVDVDGVAIVSGWKLVARIDHEDAGVIISKVAFDEEVPDKYRYGRPVCEHCNSDRKRKVVYVLKNEQTGEYKQVGATCLMDFTHGLDANYAAMYMSFIHEVEEYDGLPAVGGGPRYYSVEDYLCYAVECANKFGWTAKSSDGYSTADRAWDYYMVKEFGGSPCFGTREEVLGKMYEVGFDANSDDVITKRDAVLEFIIKNEDTSDYILTLKTLATAKYFRNRFTGFVASMVRCYDKHVEQIEREKEQRRKAAESKSKHLGSIGDKITRNIKSLQLLTSWDGMYGTTYMYSMEDDDGNVLIWKSSKWIDLDHADYHRVTGTVKEHSEFRGVKQTNLTRCSLV